MGLTYTKAGVNISEGEKLVRRIKSSVRATHGVGALGDIGGFGGLFDARLWRMRSPVLVSSIDGVGTKLLVAQKAKRHGTVGEDLVNHCVNDILACGARPLFFLDYFATGKLDAEVGVEIIGGMARACRANRCALIGGETAEMPGLYSSTEYDLCGAIVGVVERRRILDGRNIKRGDLVIGLRSSGLHTNGYSLARKVLLRRCALNRYIDELGTTLADTLLAVHRSYFPVVWPMLQQFPVRAVSHITGGGIAGNTRRVIPSGRRLRIQWNAWEKPPIFQLIQRLGRVPEADMRRTFNLGIGLAIILPGKISGRVMSYLRERGEEPLIIGEVN
ncbi:MAG: phosphoribosylformylglycinamidine cyclo-ligase [Bacteroidota bacterium]